MGKKQYTDDEICQLYAELGNLSQICRETGITRYRVRKVLRDRGVNTSDKMSRSTKEEIIKLYKTGEYTGAMLGRKFGIAPKNVNRFLRKSGIPSPGISEITRKYPINETFFDIIDAQEKAYVLGFLYADGCNHNVGNGISIGLQEKDKQILDDMTRLIQPTKPLSYEDRANQKKSQGSLNSKNQWRMTMYSKHMSDRLVELGCMPRKTFLVKFPTVEQVPDHLIRHFIRGYFDGDGSIAGKHPVTLFTGTEQFCLGVQKVLMRELGFSKTKIQSRENIFVLQYGGRLQAIAFSEWLYKDCTICLNRKREKFQTYF